MRSMTGFGVATVEGGGAAVTAEVRSVNHRFLQVKARVPVELAALESEVEARVKKRLTRGAVNATVRVEPEGGASVARVDHDVVTRYRRELDALARASGAPGELTLADWTRLPGVLVAGGAELDPAAVSRAAHRAVDEALAALCEMREVEGAAMAEDLAKNRLVLERIVARIAKRAPAVVRRLQAELRRRVAQLVDRSEVEPAELAREIALIADRADVAEELARLESHLAVLRDLVGDDKHAVGRKLDFLVQEVFREVNTIGAKCSDAKVAQWVVDAKTAVERLREQVQNVE